MRSLVEFSLLNIMAIFLEFIFVEANCANKIIWFSDFVLCIFYYLMHCQYMKERMKESRINDE